MTNGEVMRGIVDRFEGGFAVVEIEGRTKDFPYQIFRKKPFMGMWLKLMETKWKY